METLKNLFYDKKGLLRSSDLYRRAKEIDSSVTREMTKQFIQSQGVAQVFKRRKVKSFYPLIATRPGRIQIDLMDMSNEDTVTNKGRKWLFCGVDVYSRYAFIFPQRSKSEESCLESLKSLIRDAKKVGIEIYQLDSDSESSFLSRQFKAILKENNIKQNLSIVGDKKSVGIVERFNLTVRQYISRYKTAYKTTDWLSSIPDFIESYNTTEHRTLDGQTPTEAITGPGATRHMFDKTLGASEEEYNKVKFSVGDRVRLRVKHKLFEKRSTGVWTKTIHVVERIEKSEIWVNDRDTPYRKEDLLLVSEVEDPTVDLEKSREEEKVHKEQKIERRMTHRMNKEGVDKKGELTEEEKNERALRTYRKPRDIGPMILI